MVCLLLCRTPVADFRFVVSRQRRVHCERFGPPSPTFSCALGLRKDARARAGGSFLLGRLSGGLRAMPGLLADFCRDWHRAGCALWMAKKARHFSAGAVREFPNSVVGDADVRSHAALPPPQLLAQLDRSHATGFRADGAPVTQGVVHSRFL